MTPISYPLPSSLTLNLFPEQFSPVIQDLTAEALGMPQVIRDTLRDWYASPDRCDQLMALILNHCFTARVPMVSITKRVLDEAVKADGNMGDKTQLQSKTYRRLGHYLNISGLFVMTRPTTKGKRGCASLWELNNELLGLLALTPEESLAFAENIHNYFELDNRRRSTLPAREEVSK